MIRKAPARRETRIAAICTLLRRFDFAFWHL